MSTSVLTTMDFVLMGTVPTCAALCILVPYCISINSWEFSLIGFNEFDDLYMVWFKVIKTNCTIVSSYFYWDNLVVSYLSFGDITKFCWHKVLPVLPDCLLLLLSFLSARAFSEIMVIKSCSITSASSINTYLGI